MADILRQKGASAFILAMASGETVRDASVRASINERTGYARTDDPKYQAAIAAKRNEIMSAATGKIVDHLSDATSCLVGLLHASDSDTVRLGAARALLDFGLRYQPGGEVGQVADHNAGPPATIVLPAQFLAGIPQPRDDDAESE